MHYYDEESPEEEAGIARPFRLRAMLGRLLPLFRPHRRTVAAGAALMALSVGAEVSGPLVIRHLIDAAIPSHSSAAILGTAGLFLGLFVVARGAGYAEVLVFTRVGLAMVTALKRRAFDHLLELSLGYFDRHPPGKLMARVESDGERLLALFSDVAVSMAGTSVLLLGTLALMLAADVRIALGVLALVAPIAILNVFYVRYLRRFYIAMRRAYARLSAFLAEYVQAVPVIQVFGLEGAATARLDRRNRDRLRADIGAAFREYPFWGAIQAAEAAVVMAILFFGSERVLGAAMSVGTLVLFVEYARRLFMPVVQLTEQVSFVQRAFASAERVFEVLDTPSLTPDRPGARDAIPADWRELAFDQVSFAYVEGGRPALGGLRFAVRRGERIALVGPSGGGKTTIASLLLRFYDPSGGRIALDGLDIRDFRKRAWRRHVGLVLQDIQLFPVTLRENLTVFSEGVSDEAIERALEIVQAREIVDRAPKGLATELAEGGANISMGERQLISFARALIRDPEILVLDEATSSVDPATERRLQASLERLLAGRTSIIIAHRLETIRRADRILVVEGGRLVEEGRHEDLYARGGRYRVLYDLQLGSLAAAAPFALPPLEAAAAPAGAEAGAAVAAGEEAA